MGEKDSVFWHTITSGSISLVITSTKFITAVSTIACVKTGSLCTATCLSRSVATQHNSKHPQATLILIIIIISHTIAGMMSVPTLPLSSVSKVLNTKSAACSWLSSLSQITESMMSCWCCRLHPLLCTPLDWSHNRSPTWADLQWLV